MIVYGRWIGIIGCACIVRLLLTVKLRITFITVAGSAVLIEFIFQKSTVSFTLAFHLRIHIRLLLHDVILYRFGFKIRQISQKSHKIRKKVFRFIQL